MAALELSAEAKIKRRRNQNLISQRKCRERDKTCGKRANHKRLKSAPAERRTTRHHSRYVALEQHGQDKTPLAGGTDHAALAHSHSGLVVQPSSSTSSSCSRDLATMAEYTSPFEDGYALMKGGPAWDCIETTGTRKDGDT